MLRLPLASASVALLLAGCSHSRTETVAAPLPAPAPVPRAAMPIPPLGAASNLTIPARLSEGSYATPNRQVSATAAVWHVRVALNVAALGCRNSPTILPGYNKLLAAQRKPFADAHNAVAREYADSASFDTAMTRLYNYFAQPPVQPSFCATAEAVLTEAAALPADAFPQFAAQALPRLDRPFTEFYAAYDRYRSDLAVWQAGSQQPRLNYDPAVFAASEQVTGRDVTGVASR
jgi:hypothetical protein